MKMFTGAILILAAAILIAGSSISLAIQNSQVQGKRNYFAVWRPEDHVAFIMEWSGVVMLVSGVALMLWGLFAEEKA